VTDSQMFHAKAQWSMPSRHGIRRAAVSILTLTWSLLALPLGAQTWTQLAPGGTPPEARAWASAILDASTGKMITFDGTFEGTNFNDVWSLSTSASPQWTQVSPGGAVPPARLGQSGVYDSANSRIIMFGGGTGANLAPCVNDVWVLSNANSVNGTPTWAQLNTTGGPPAPRIFHTAVYSPATNTMTVFGGSNCSLGSPQYFNDVWVLSNANGLGGNPVWTQLTPSGGPSARQGATAAYDPNSNRMIVFGGYNNLPFSEVWVLSNANGTGGTPVWTQLAPGGTIPPPRDFQSTVYDPVSNRMVVFGGIDVGQLLNDTWTLSFANGLGGTPSWSSEAPSPSIPTGEARTAVYDATGNRMIVFGGLTGNGYSNATWTLSNPNGLAPTPQAVSVTPSSGASSSQTFSFVYTDGNGATDLASAQAIINTSVTSVSSCYVWVTPGTGTIWLANDAGSWPASMTLGSAGTLQNSQCAVNVGSSSGSLSGNIYTLNLAISFESGFSGPKDIFSQATSMGAQSSGWQAVGSWTAVSSGPVRAVSVSPSSGSGPGLTFTFVYTDSNGASDLASAQVIINTSITSISSCYVWVTPGTGTIWLANDAGSWPASMTLGSAGTLQNSQCAVNVGSSSGSLSGNTYTLNLAITFQGGFSGLKNIYSQATNTTLSSGWQMVGTWTAMGAGTVIHAVSVNPSSGNGSGQTFTFVYTDSNGASDLASAQALINTSITSVSSCYVWVTPGTGTIWLADNSGNWPSPLTLGSAGTLQNSQCAVNVGSSSASLSGTTYTLNLAITFQSGFNGLKNIYSQATNTTLSTGWQMLGTWTAAGGGATVHAVSVTPASGGGLSQTFSFVYTDSNGGSDFASAQALINSSITSVSSCYVWVTPGTGTIWLADNSGNWPASMTLGSAGTLQNSQCAVNVGSSSGALSGSTYTLNLAITFQSGFVGSKNIYSQATTTIGNQSTGWVALGTWTP
jgi:hypothetical protein